MKAHPEIESLTPYQPGKPIAETKREFGLDQVHKLASNESPLGPSPAVRRALLEQIDGVNRYPDGACFEMRRAVSDYYGVPTDWLAFGNGSDEVIDILVQAYCDHERDSILTSVGAFCAYEMSAQSVRVRVRHTPLTTDLRFDLTAMAATLERDPSIRFVFLPNPNNPTGTYFTDDEFARFMAVARRHDVLVVLDEAYVEFVRAKDFPRGRDVQKLYPNVLLLRTMSKVFGLAGLRVGILIAPPAVVDVFNRVRKPFNVNSFAQAATVAALGDADHLRKIQRLTWEGIDYFALKLTELGLRFWPSQANFTLFDCGRDAGPVFDQLLRRGVILRPVRAYGFPNYLRMSVGLPQENAAAVDALRAVLINGASTAASSD